MVMTNLSSAVLFAATVGLAGCQDARTVDPYPGKWLIDDFKSPTGDPTDPNFEPWGCRLVDDTHQIGPDDCNSTSIDNHESVLHLAATLVPANSDSKLAEVVTYAKPTQDFTPYATFWFSWKLVSGDPPLPAATLLKVQLTCTSVRDADGSVSTNPCVVKTVISSYADTSDWNGPIPLQLSDFAPPEDYTPKPNLQDCLARVDGIKITVQSDPSAAARFDLYVDDISLEPKE
jgi:hypothetical protein